MKMTKSSEILYRYWPPDNTDELLSRREFYLTRAYTPITNDDSCDISRFTLTGTQRFLCNLLAPGSPCNGLLLFHGTGAMKTCTAVSICEGFSASRRVFLISRPILHENFMRTVFDPSRPRDMQCTGDTYVSRAHGSMDRAQQLVASRYTPLGLIQFANSVASSTDRELVETYGGNIIVVDEAHQLRGENAIVHNALSRVLRVCGDMKLLLLTATPMFNSPADILPLLNLLRDNDLVEDKALLPSDFFTRQNGQWVLNKKGGAELLFRAAKGYISYAKGQSTNTFPTLLYPSVNGDKLVMATMEQFPSRDIFGDLIPKSESLIQNMMMTGAWEICGSKMKGVQLATYNDATRNNNMHSNIRDTDNDNDNDSDDDDEENSYMGAHQLCNIVFPPLGNTVLDYSKKTESGYAAFKRCFEFDRVSQRWTYKKSVPPFLSPSHIEDHACKIDAIVNRICNATDSVSLVYSRWIWSGIMPLSIALEHRGFTQFRSYGSSSSKNTYAIISGLSDINEVKSILNAVRSDDNMRGDIIRVVLITERGSEGIDFKFIRELHIMEPWYHMKKIGQVIGRAARHCSHSLLPPKDRNVTIYLHATRNSSTDNETLDMRAYRVSFLKEKNIREVENVLQRAAIDYVTAKHDRKSAVSRKMTMVSAQGKRCTIHVENSPPWSIPSDLVVSDATFDATRHVDLKSVSDIVRKELGMHNVCLFSDVCNKVQSELFCNNRIRKVLNKNNHENWVELVVDACLESAHACRRVDRIVHVDKNRYNTVLLTSPVPRVHTEVVLHNNKLLLSASASDPNTKAPHRMDDLLAQRNRILRLWKFSDITKEDIRRAATDFVVDRLNREELLTLASSVTKSDFTHSLERAGVIVKHGRLVHIPSYGRESASPEWLCADDNSGLFRRCATGEIPVSKKTSALPSYLSPLNIKGYMGWSRRTHSYVFKTITSTIPMGSECDRTSSIKVNWLRTELRSILKQHAIKADVTNQNTKHVACILFELALRTYVPSKFGRPLDAEIMFSHYNR
jgi:SNF2-related domain